MEVTLINVGDIIAYGLRCVSSNLKKNGVNTRIVFIPPRFADISHERLFAGIEGVAKDSALIGISLMAGQFKSAVYLTEHLKKRLGVPVCWGGVHPTICPEDCIEHADIICRGEAEDTIVELAKRMQDNEGLDGLDGVWFKKGAAIVRNPQRGIPADLNPYPPPDHDFGSHYIFDYETGTMNQMSERYFFKYRGNRYTTLPTRGCAMNCTYCINNYLHQMDPKSNRLRFKSADNIISELRWVKDNLGFIREIDFYDDDFMLLPLGYLEEFSEKYRRHIDLPLVITGISPHNFSEEKLELIRSHIHISKWRLGIQSGSERTRREVYNRRHSNEKLFRIIDYFSRYRKVSEIDYDLILENPWETEQDLVETFHFLMKIPRPFRLLVYYLTFYPGTALYERAKKEGLLNSSNDGLSSKYQAPRARHTLNRIIASVDKLPGWLLRLLFYSRNTGVLSDILLAAANLAIAVRRRGAVMLGAVRRWHAGRALPQRAGWSR